MKVTLPAVAVGKGQRAAGIGQWSVANVAKASMMMT